MRSHVLYIDCTSIVFIGCSYKWAVSKCSSGSYLVVLEGALKLVLYLWLVVLTSGLGS